MSVTEQICWRVSSRRSITELKNSELSPNNPWPHRLAVVLACATFPLVWIGGLVTSSDAGMAVPDWPTTYGYNLWLYPWRTWFYGPWDLFIEHGHRLFASVVGLLAIALLVSLLRWESRRWVKSLGAITLAAVIFQGILGGMRVIQNEVLLAKVHGCFGPAFFALAAAMATVTSARWRSAGAGESNSHASRLHALAITTTTLAYLQVVLGAQLRHIAPGTGHDSFRIALVFHLIGAALVVMHALLLGWHICGTHWRHSALARPALLLVGLVTLQVSLGGAAYVTNYGWPEWAVNEWTVGYVVHAKGSAQVHATTAHVAIGSLILVTALVISLRALRLVRRDSSSFQVAPLAAGAAG